MTAPNLVAKWSASASAPRLLSVLRIVAAFMFVLAGTMKLFAFQFPRSFWPVMNGGVPAMLYCFVWLYFSTPGAGPWSLDAKRRKPDPAPHGGEAQRHPRVVSS